MPNLEVNSPEWWVQRLHKDLISRQEHITLMDRYYRGDHPLPWLAPQAHDDFRRILKMSRSNYMGLVCDAQVERQTLEGFRVGIEHDADSEMWRIWQSNRLDSDFDQGMLEASIAGMAYILVAPNPDDASTPRMWIEHPSQAIVAYTPGSGRNSRAAGLKVWEDETTGKMLATLYLPDWIYKYESESKRAMPSDQVKWVKREVPGEEWPAANPLKVVPLVELPNNPRLLSGGVSELADVTDIQDRVNKTIADRLMTQDFGAFPQKWAKGWPEEDESGNVNERLDIGRDRLITTDSVDAAFGQFDAAPLDPYSAAKREDVKDIASRTRTPAQYLLGEMSNVNGETLKASESGLISKVRQRCRPITEGVKDALSIVRRIAGLPDEPIECIWRNPEFRTEGELVDALVKMATLNVPEEALWERWGATPQERERWREWNKERKIDHTLVEMNKQLNSPNPVV